MRSFDDRRPSVLRTNVRFSGARRSKLRWLGIILLLTTCASIAILCLLGAQLILRLLFAQNDLFRITSIKIDCAGEVLTPAHILEYSGLDNCSNLFAFSIGTVRDKLQRDVPVIESVEIRRKLPGTLLIRVKERTPVARFDKEGYYMEIDREGHVLGKLPGPKDLPVITGYNPPGLKPGMVLSGTPVMNALDIVRVCGTTPIGRVVRPASIDVSQKEWLELHLADGERVLFSWQHMGEGTPLAFDELQKKMLKLVQNLRAASARGKKIALIDMTLENNFPAQEY